jgi:hypothetical protein
MRESERKAMLAALSSTQRDTLRRATMRGQGVDEAARLARCSRKQAVAAREHMAVIGVLSTAPSRAPATTRPVDSRQLGMF